MMKKIILSLFISGFCFAQVFETVPLMQNGANDKRITIAILGDGFTANELPSFTTSAQSTINYLFSTSPYMEYKNYFNAYAVKVVSQESGIKHPGTAWDVTEPVFPVSNPNNYFGSSFDTGVHRCYSVYSGTKITQVLAANVPDYDVVYILGNTTQYGGCGGYYAFATLDALANQILVHELGHSFAQLADEYWFAPGERINRTQVSDPATIKWKNWLGINGVGIYPHAESPSWYRPHQSCTMRTLGPQFCSVCKEGIVEKIHSLVSPVDDYFPNNNSTVDINSDITFSVTEILPIPNTLANSWVLNGVTLASTNNSMVISPNQLNSGINTLLFSVVDNTPLVKVNNHSTVHFTNILWTLNKLQTGTPEIEAEEWAFGLYPNPAEKEFYIVAKQSFSTDIEVVLYDMSGKLIPVKFGLETEKKLYVDINDLLPGTYYVNIKNNKKLIISQKIIKE